ncbi:hypothetical protein M0R45_019314 [Rubus argutus]|uniref:Uncharacterized protein n=1 Tax=Rubus argutus TaxID=59490 RepID=A0AAW1X521_RUBAR
MPVLKTRTITQVIHGAVPKLLPSLLCRVTTVKHRRAQPVPSCCRHSPAKLLPAQPPTRVHQERRKSHHASSHLVTVNYASGVDTVLGSCRQLHGAPLPLSRFSTRVQLTNQPVPKQTGSHLPKQPSLPRNAPASCLARYFPRGRHCPRAQPSPLVVLIPPHLCPCTVHKVLAAVRPCPLLIIYLSHSLSPPPSSSHQATFSKLHQAQHGLF